MAASCPWSAGADAAQGDVNISFAVCTTISKQRRDRTRHEQPPCELAGGCWVPARLLVPCALPPTCCSPSSGLIPSPLDPEGGCVATSERRMRWPGCCVIFLATSQSSTRPPALPVSLRPRNGVKKPTPSEEATCDLFSQWPASASNPVGQRLEMIPHPSLGAAPATRERGSKELSPPSRIQTADL